VELEGPVASVTRANRGLGLAFAGALVARGARRLYGAARDPATVEEPGLTPVVLDIADPELVTDVARTSPGRRPVGQTTPG
jgi:NAD(P)-dependent dehydrogenase (short-subunit alcohol dehydrogenase family)